MSSASERMDREWLGRTVPAQKSDSVHVMKKGARRVLIDLKSGASIEVALDRLTFADDDVLLWADGIETARFRISEMLSMDFQLGASIHSIDEVRASHRNAYAKWTGEEDALLLDLAKKSTTVADIAALFGRQESAIDSRLAKLSVRLLTHTPEPESHHGRPKA